MSQSVKSVVKATELASREAGLSVVYTSRFKVKDKDKAQQI
ncbi:MULTISPECIES: hypothetical protein [unclassified Shewanella]|nr:MULTISPECIES: hypothetical protein [unclassified Shewanella]